MNHIPIIIDNSLATRCFNLHIHITQDMPRKKIFIKTLFTRPRLNDNYVWAEREERTDSNPGFPWMIIEGSET